VTCQSPDFETRKNNELGKKKREDLLSRFLQRQASLLALLFSIDAKESEILDQCDETTPVGVLSSISRISIKTLEQLPRDKSLVNVNPT
jgi:hypothetical protein